MYARIRVILSDSRWLYLLLGLICIWAWYKHVMFIELYTGFSGFSSIDWLATLTEPQNFTQGFPIGVGVYRLSLFMHIYPLLNWLQISSSHSMAIVLILNLSLLAYAYHFLVRTLAPESSVMVSITVIAFAFFTHVNGLNLANFGGNVFNGLYYDSADAFRILAIALWLRKQTIASIIFITLSMMSHLTMGLYGLIFIGGMQLINIRYFLNPKILKAFLIAGIIVLAWTFWQMPGHGVYASMISNKNWFFYTELTNYHWYPLALKRFTKNFPLFFSFLSLSVITYYSLFKFPNKNYKRMFLLGFATTLFITTLGVLISIIKPSPFLIKLAFHRASELIPRIGIVFIAIYFWQVIKDGSAFYKGIALTLLCTPFFFTKNPFLLITIWLATLPVLLQLIRGRFSTENFIILGLVLLLTLLAFYYDTAHYINSPIKLKEYFFGTQTLQYNFIYAFIAGLFFSFLSIVINNKWNFFYYLAIIIFFGCLLINIENSRIYDFHKKQQVALAKSYVEVQHWANTHTPKKAMFMIDPAIPKYGWRAYSHRPSIGRPRQWLFTWLYTSDYHVYQRGLKLINEYHLPLSTFLEGKKVNVNSANKYYQQLGKQFYVLLNTPWIYQMVQKYQIDYIVLKKRKGGSLTVPYQKVYENTNFIVLATNGHFHEKSNT